MGFWVGGTGRAAGPSLYGAPLSPPTQAETQTRNQSQFLLCHAELSPLFSESPSSLISVNALGAALTTSDMTSRTWRTVQRSH
jgi:hypothetical protein